jgi:hypothetical protein
MSAFGGGGGEGGTEAYTAGGQPDSYGLESSMFSAKEFRGPQRGVGGEGGRRR